MRRRFISPIKLSYSEADFHCVFWIQKLYPARLLVKARDRRFQPQVQEAQPACEFQDGPGNEVITVKENLIIFRANRNDRLGGNYMGILAYFVIKEIVIAARPQQN